MGDLEGESAGPGDGAEKEACGDPGGEAHLAGLEDDIARSAASLEGLLHGVGLEKNAAATACAHAQPPRSEGFEHRLAVETARAAVENAAVRREVFDARGHLIEVDHGMNLVEAGNERTGNRDQGTGTRD